MLTQSFPPGLRVGEFDLESWSLETFVYADYRFQTLSFRYLSECQPHAIGLVVQPGVEFDHHDVVDFQPEKARTLSAAGVWTISLIPQGPQ